MISDATYTEIYIHLSIHACYDHVILCLFRHEFLGIKHPSETHHVAKKPLALHTPTRIEQHDHIVHAIHHIIETPGIHVHLSLNSTCYLYELVVRVDRLKLVDDVLPLTILHVLRVIKRNAVQFITNCFQFTHNRSGSFFLNGLHDLVILRCGMKTLSQFRCFLNQSSALSLVVLLRKRRQKVH